MNVAQVAAEIIKREGNDYLLAYPLNPLTESCAAVGVRPIIVRQERIGLHMADCISRQTSGEKVGVFCMQVGPGCENSFGAVAQAWSEGVPLVVMPGGYARETSFVRPNFNATGLCRERVAGRHAAGRPHDCGPLGRSDRDLSGSGRR